jgi:hypothetical protein
MSPLYLTETMRILPLLLLSAAAFSFQGDSLSRRPPEVLALIEQARALPPEFRADTLLRLAGSSLVAQPSWKQELIEQAYESGSYASLPYMQKADGRADSVAASAVRANRLEALTLQAKAVQAMLPLDSRKARRLFEEISPTVLPKLNCWIVSTPEIVDYYQTALLVFEGAFSAKQRTEGEDVAMLRRLVASVEAPAQVPPALEMLFAVKVPPAQRRDLLSLLGAELQAISRSDREYGAAETALASAIAMAHMTSSEAAVVIPALRSYIVTHVSSRRCTDNLPVAGKLAKSARQFNSLVVKLDPGAARYKQISAKEAEPAGDDGTYQRSLIGKSVQSQAVTDAIRWLTHRESLRDGRIVPWTLVERSSQNWLARYDDAAKLVHELKEGDEASPEAFFCTKADALNALAVLAPADSTREKAMDEYREFLETYYPSIQNPNLWFTMFRHMLYTARFSGDPRDRAWILDELAGSTNSIIALYAKLETRIGPPSGTYPPSQVQITHR